MRLKFFAAMVVLLTSLVGRADTFNFNFSGGGGGFTGAGTLAAVNSGAGVYTITGITGSGSGAGISGLTNFNGNDNLLFPLGIPVVDSHGFSFIDILGPDTFFVNIYASGGSYFAFLRDEDNFTQTLGVTLNVSPAATVTPEPSTFALLGSGLLGVAAFMKRRVA